MTGMRRIGWIISLLAIIGLFVGTACIAPASTPAKPQERVVLGLIGAMTGPNSDLGSLVRNGAEVAADEINDSGGVLGKQIEFVVLDTGGDPAAAVTGFKRAITQEKAVALIGPTTSTEALAVKQVVNEAKILQIIANAANGETLMDAPYSFNVTPINDDMTKALLKVAEKNGNLKPAIIHDTSGYGQGGVADLEKGRAGLNITFPVKVPFQAPANDLTPQVLQARQSGADSLIVWATGGDSGLVAQNMRQIGWNVPLYSSPAMMQPSARRVGDAALEGSVVPSPIDSDNPNLPAYLDRYERKTGTRPALDNVPVQGYIAVKLFAMAAAKAGKLDSESLKKAMETIEWKGSPYGPGASAIKLGPDDHRVVSEDFVTPYRFEKGQWIKTKK